MTQKLMFADVLDDGISGTSLQGHIARSTVEQPIPDLFLDDQMLSEFGWEMDDTYFASDPIAQRDGIWDQSQTLQT